MSTTTSKKTTMSLADRYWILSIFPEHGDYYSLLARKSIAQKVIVTAAETKKFDIVQENNAIRWNELGQKSQFPIDFTTIELAEIKAALNALNAAKKLKPELIDLYEKFAL